ncbi:MAG: primosomal protein N' [Lachnospiraceae bacterium]|nr:primosomal protein N' [Lachnospiraceae bacterium]
MYADIIIDISHEKLDKSFQYEIPSALESEVTIGSRVEVSFGKGEGRKITGYVVNISEKPNWDPAKIKPILRVSKDANAIEDQLIALAAWMKSHYGGTMNQALKTVLPIKKKENVLKKKEVTLILDDKKANDVYVDLVARKNHSVGKERLLKALMEDRQIPWDAVTKKLNVPTSVIRDFEKSGYVRITEKREFRKPTDKIEGNWTKHHLNSMQQGVVDTFVNDYNQGIRKPYLLYGVTGSGKTEVYLEMIDHVLKEGKQVIVLIPEISLTYQTLVRFYRRFGDVVSIMNSRLSPGERFDQFERAKNGDIQIMIGPRSALFTPFPNLGLIVMDEEHDDSYKSEQIPRYHARETAVQRAAMANAPIVLGSATPSVESFTRAKSGEYTMLSMPSRVENRPLPECEIVDLRQELMNGNRSILSMSLQQEMEKRLQNHEQAMLFINRRGLMGFVSCRACGHVVKCPHCDVSLSLHKNGKLTCHYCGYETEKPAVCPECGSKYIGGFRAGTEKIEEIVKERFPGVRTLRMDADTTKGKNSHQDILNAFSNGEADVLIGTQMIVKGHDFPGVTLMGILAADMSLNVSDYRCAERTFQMITQAAGRAGRGDMPGRVIIQTYQPDHYSITSAAAQDYEEFYKMESTYRNLMNYPPYCHMLSIQITSEMEPEADGKAKMLAEFIRSLGVKVMIFGPQDAGIAKMKDIYRKVIYLRHTEYDLLVEIKDKIESLLLENNRYRNAHVSFDFNPMNGF